MKKTYLFDFDGTLVDSMPSFISVMLRILDENGIKYGDDIVKTITPLGYLGTARHFIKLGLKSSEEELVKKLNKKKAEDKEEDETDKKEPIVDYFRELELRVQSALGRRCIIEEKGRKKSITLYYEDNYDLTELLESILGKDFLDN